MTEEFRRLLLEGVERAGGQENLGTQIGAQRTRVSEALGGKGYPLDIEPILRLALFVEHFDPPAVLRASGGRRQTAVAEVLEALYGVAGRDILTVQERELHGQLQALRDADPDAYQKALAMFRVFVEAVLRAKGKTANV